jgi:hypothetical protein
LSYDVVITDAIKYVNDKMQQLDKTQKELQEQQIQEDNNIKQRQQKTNNSIF